MTINNQAVDFERMRADVEQAKVDIAGDGYAANASNTVRACVIHADTLLSELASAQRRQDALLAACIAAKGWIMSDDCGADAKNWRGLVQQLDAAIIKEKAASNPLLR